MLGVCLRIAVSLCYVDHEVRPDATILYHGSNSSIYQVMLPPGDKADSYKLCITIEGVDAYLAKAPVTISIRVS